MLSLSLSLPHFPITITAETSFSYPVIFDWEEPRLEAKEGNWQTAFYMNYNASCFYLGIHLKKQRSYWVVGTSQNSGPGGGYCQSGCSFCVLRCC